MTRKITGAALYGYDAPTSESGIGLYAVPGGAGMVGVPPSTAPVATIPAAYRLPGVNRDFFRSSDFGLILFGLALVYFDLRILNR